MLSTGDHGPLKEIALADNFQPKLEAVLAQDDGELLTLLVNKSGVALDSLQDTCALRWIFRRTPVLFLASTGASTCGAVWRR